MKIHLAKMSLNDTMHSLQYLPFLVRGKRQGKINELSKDRKGMLIYAMATATGGFFFLWKKSHE